MTCGVKQYDFAVSGLLLNPQEEEETFPAAASMTSESADSSIEDVPTTFKLFVWHHFVYLVEIIRVTDIT